MERLARVISAAFVGAAGCLLAVMPVQAQGPPRVGQVTGVQARLMSGSITGTVKDDQGIALAGAMVSALGATLASTVTDDRGRFNFSELPAGDYLLRAHMIGFVASTGTRVRVGAAPSVHFQLRRVDAAVGTAGANASPVRSRPIIAAGFDLPKGADSETDAAATSGDADHPHDETAWRLRHLTRSVLKDAAPSVALIEDDPEPSGASAVRATMAAASVATSVFSGFPLSGEVNFLTTGAAAPGQLLSATAWPRGVAYLALAAPGSGGDWSMRAAMSEGDLSSWIVAGAFASKLTRVHAYDFGASYSTQEYQGGNPAALLAVTDGRRNVGELYALDRWRVTKPLTIEYGARYAHYDYLDAQGMLSPRVGLTLRGSNGRIRTTVAQRMVAPGAEEFLASNARGPWIPPERTFAPLAEPGDLDTFRVERARSYDVTVERDIGEAFVLGISRFYQSIDDQLVTLFGMQLPGGPQSVGHYYVGNAGSLNANGWTFAFETRPTARVQGAIRYSVTRARWSASASDDLALLAPLAPAAVRIGTEDIHDLTSSVKADISETATRVFVLYKLNSGYIRSNPALGPGLDGRFDVQVNQAIPVTFAGTRWEVLVGMRNLFRDPTDPASVYDELLVVRPPKRIVGGVLVKF